jgi:hypothetical protein
MSIIPFTLISFGVTAIITKGSIFEGFRRFWYEKLRGFKPWRSLHTFFNCPLCVGFWAGLIVSLCGQGITGNFFFDGCIASGTSWFIMLLEYFLIKPTNGKGCKGCGGK